MNCTHFKLLSKNLYFSLTCIQGKKKLIIIILNEKYKYILKGKGIYLLKFIFQHYKMCFINLKECLPNNIYMYINNFSWKTLLLLKDIETLIAIINFI